MKTLYKINCKNRTKNKLITASNAVNTIFFNERIRKNNRDRKGKWMTFYFPVVANCLYTIKGCLIRKHRQSTIDHSVIARAIISKESIEFNVPVCRTSIIYK